MFHVRFEVFAEGRDGFGELAKPVSANLSTQIASPASNPRDKSGARNVA